MKTFARCLVLMVLAGCVGQHEYQGVRLYDLQTRYSTPGAPASPTPATVTVEPFRMMAPAGTRMLVRRGGRELEQDDYNRWVQPPEKCIAREFHMAVQRRFKPAQAGKHARLYGAVATFESSGAETARVAIELKLIDDATGKALLTKLYEREEPLADKKPTAYANAAAKALESIIDEALEDMANALAGR